MNIENNEMEMTSGAGVAASPARHVAHVSGVLMIRLRRGAGTTVSKEVNTLRKESLARGGARLVHSYYNCWCEREAVAGFPFFFFFLE